MSNLKEKSLIGLGVGLGVSAITGAWYWYKSKVQNTPPEKWRHVGTISELHFFPIKSCGGLQVNEVNCNITGVIEGRIKDRMFMLIDADRKAVTARTYPHMFHIKPKIENDSLTLTAPKMEPIRIDFERIAEGEVVQADIFGANVHVVECGEVYDKWFTQYVTNNETKLKLVYYTYPVATKPIAKKLVNGVFSTDDTGTLHDVSSYMLINDTSVQELNTRLKDPIEARQFRPNFIVKTNGPPYDEDKWQWIRIGKEAMFRNVAPCYRCILPNINPDSAERNKDFEPLSTLKRYRKDGSGDSPAMGLQLGLRHPGMVKVGDDVFVQA